MMKRSQKDAVIAELKSDLEKAKAVYLTNLIGVEVNPTVEIRAKVRAAQGKIRVTRNTLFGKAAEGTPAADLLSGLKGPHAVAFAFEDVAAVAKVLKESGKDYEQVELKGGVLDGQILSVEEVKALADLPSRDEMLGTLLATFIAPVSAFARLMNSIKDECEEQGVETPGALKVEGAAEEAAAE